MNSERVSRTELHSVILRLTEDFSQTSTEEFLRITANFTEDEKKAVNGKGLTVGRFILRRKKRTFVWQERHEGLKLGGICLVTTRKNIHLPPLFFLSYKKTENRYVWSRFCQMNYEASGSTFLKGRYVSTETWENGITPRKPTANTYIGVSLEICFGFLASLICVALIWLLIYQ